MSASSKFDLRMTEPNQKPRKCVEVDAVNMRVINFVIFVNFAWFQRLQLLAAIHV